MISERGRVITLDHYETFGLSGNLGAEKVLCQSLFDFDDLPDTYIKVAASCVWNHNGSDAVTFVLRVRVGGTYLGADGTEAAILSFPCTGHNPALQYKRRLVGTIARPTGPQFIKITGIGNASQSAYVIDHYVCFLVGTEDPA